MNSPVGAAATLGRLSAVAGLTFKEAVRRRIFLVVIVVGAAIISSAAFFPSIDASGRLRLIEIWAVRTVSFFGCLGGIFFAGWSLPSDFEQRRVYTLVTKPIHKGTLFLGKLLGFSLLLGAFLLAMAAITLGYIRVVAATTPGFPALAARPHHQAAGFTSEGEALRNPENDARAVQGHKQGHLVWTFAGIVPDREVTGRVQLDLARPPARYALEGMVYVRVVNPATGRHREVPYNVQTNRPMPFSFPAEFVSPSGEVRVLVRPADLDLTTAGRTDSVVLESRSNSFELNFLKGLLLLFLQAFLVLLATLAASTFVSSPVSILLGIFLFLVGTGWGFVQEATTDVRTALDELRQRPDDPAVRAQAEDVPPWMLEISQAVSGVVLAVVPNFDQYNFADWLLRDKAVGAGDLLSGLRSVAPLVAVLLAAGLLGMAFRDFAT